MTKITKTNLTIAYQTSPVEKGVYASFGADETLVSLSYYKNGKPIETLSLDQGASEGYSAKYEYFELGVDGYEGDYSGLQAMGISEEQFDGMNPANQTITLNQLEYKEWLDSKIAYIGRDRTPNYKTYCNFCGKEQKEVKKLIMGPAFGICNECVDLCNDIMKEDG